jgi:hypothetical protein
MRIDGAKPLEGGGIIIRRENNNRGQQIVEGGGGTRLGNGGTKRCNQLRKYDL